MRPRPTRLHEVWAPWAPLMFLFDIAGVYVGGLAAARALAALLPAAKATFLWPLPSAYHGVVLAAACLLPLLLHAMSGYRPWRGMALDAEIWLAMLAWITVFMLFAVIALLTKTGDVFSRRWLTLWFLSTLLALIFGRLLLRVILRDIRRRGLDIKEIVLIGGEQLGQRVYQVLSDNAWAGFRVVGYFDNRENGSLFAACPWLGNFGDLPAYLKRNHPHQIWIALPLTAQNRIQEILTAVQERAVDIRMVPDIFSYQLLNHSIETIVGLPVLNLSASPHTGLDHFIKRALDIFAASAGLAVLFPLLLAITIAVKTTSPGPILFRQKRHGWDGRPFRVFKFRTMYVQGRAAKPQEYRQARKADPRITPLGRWLRASSLDELPQLMNVLRGEMSLVGPRPHPVEMNRQYRNRVDRYLLRHRVKPGITGWAQINGFRGETDTLEKMELRIAYDLYYIENWSLWLDIKILLLTPLRAFRDPNAY